MNDKELNIIQGYKDLKPPLNEWGSTVDCYLIERVLQILIKQGFVKILPTYRLKGDKSLLYKALYRTEEVYEPLINIEDKIATRIVLLKSDEIDHAVQLILNFNEWICKITKNFKQTIEDQPKIFDYQSFHIVVSPLESSGLFHKYGKAISCEIQIRTLLQHAFAEISHDSTYKGVYRDDSEILRHLSKSMALMEATDDYFNRVFSLMANEEREMKLFVKEIINLFKKFYPYFDKENVDYDFTYRILSLFHKERVELGDIEAFISKYQSELTKAYNGKNGLIFNQPISILIAYYLYYKQSFLRDAWPLNQEALKEVFRAFNVSFGSY